MRIALDNEVIFKKAFTNKIVFEAFVRDVLGIKVDFGKIETEKRFEPRKIKKPQRLLLPKSGELKLLTTPKTVSEKATTIMLLQILQI